MRAVMIASALWAALAMASPAQQKRAVVVTQYHTQVVTEVVTVRAQRTRFNPHGGRHRTRTITIRPQPQPTVVDEPEDEETSAPVSLPVQSEPAPEVQSTTTSEPSEPVTVTPPGSSSTSEPEPEPTDEPTEEPTEEPTIATTEAETQPTAGTAPGPGSSYKEQCLYHHNQHRLNHSAPALVWDEDLVASARILAERCVWKHDMNINGGGYGQNNGLSSDNAPIGRTITNGFYNGEFELYPGYGREPGAMTGWGHFSQVLWKSTSAVGCYTADCTSGMQGIDFDGYFTVCNYRGPGNVLGGYAENVLPPKGMPIIFG